jgi:hypothetical protein
MGEDTDTVIYTLLDGEETPVVSEDDRVCPARKDVCSEGWSQYGGGVFVRVGQPRSESLLDKISEVPAIP